MQYHITMQSRTFPKEYDTNGDHDSFICPICNKEVPIERFSFQSTSISGICECPGCHNRYTISR